MTLADKCSYLKKLESKAYVSNGETGTFRVLQQEALDVQSMV